MALTSEGLNYYDVKMENIIILLCVRSGADEKDFYHWNIYIMVDFNSETIVICRLLITFYRHKQTNTHTHTHIIICRRIVIAERTI